MKLLFCLPLFLGLFSISNAQDTGAPDREAKAKQRIEEMKKKIGKLNVLEKKALEVFKKEFPPVFKHISGKELPQIQSEGISLKMLSQLRQVKALALRVGDPKILADPKAEVKGFQEAQKYLLAQKKLIGNSKLKRDAEKLVFCNHAVAVKGKETNVDKLFLVRMAKYIKVRDMFRQRTVMVMIAKEVYKKALKVKPKTIADLKLPRHMQFIDPDTRKNLDWILMNVDSNNDEDAYIVGPKPIMGKYVICLKNGAVLTVTEKEAKEKYLKNLAPKKEAAK